MKILSTKPATQTQDKPSVDTVSESSDGMDLMGNNFFSNLIANTDGAKSSVTAGSGDSVETAADDVDDESNQPVNAESMLQELQMMTSQLTPKPVDPNVDTETVTSDLTPTVATLNGDAQAGDAMQIKQLGEPDMTVVADTKQPALDPALQQNVMDDKSNPDKQLTDEQKDSDAIEKLSAMKSQRLDDMKVDDSSKPSDIAPSLNQVSATEHFQAAHKNESPVPQNNVMESMDKFAQLVHAKMHAQPANQNANEMGLANSALRASTADVAPATSTQAMLSANTMAFDVEEQHMSSQAINLSTYHANIKIYPPELGQITANLKINNNRAILEITTANAQTKEILNSHLDDLRQQFSQSNLELDSIQINIQEPHTADKEQSQNQRDSDDRVMDPVAMQQAERGQQSIESIRKRENALVDAYI